MGHQKTLENKIIELLSAEAEFWISLKTWKICILFAEIPLGSKLCSNLLRFLCRFHKNSIDSVLPRQLLTRSKEVDRQQIQNKLNQVFLHTARNLNSAASS